MEFDQAVGSLNSAISVLQKRIDNLKAKTESVDPSKKADAFYTREAEVKKYFLCSINVAAFRSSGQCSRRNRGNS